MGGEMKKLIVFVILAMAIPVSAQVFSIQGEWKKSECSICGRTIEQYSEPSFHSYGESTNFSYQSFGKELATTFGNEERKICAICKKRYLAVYEKLISLFYEEAIADNDGLRRYHKYRREQDKLNELQEQIKKLNKQLNEFSK